MVLGSEWAQLEVIDLINDGTGLGFGIIGGKSTGVVIKTILPGGVSYRDGRLKSGDHIIQIGDVNVRGLTSEQVALILRQCGVHVHLIVARPTDDATQVQRPFAPVVRTSEVDLALDRLNKLLSDQGGEYPEGLLSVSAAAGNGEAYSIKESLPSLSQSVAPSDLDSDSFEIELTKDANGLGITISGYADPADGGRPNIFISAITEGSVAAKCGRIHVGHQIIAVDDKPLNGYTSQEALDVLRRTGQVVRLKIAGHSDQKKFSPQKSQNVAVAPVASKLPDAVAMWQNNCGNDCEIIVSDLVKFKDGGGLGISLEGTVDLESNEEKNPRHFIGTVLPDGPVGINGLLKSGDELLQANDTRLTGLSHIKVVQILKELPSHVTLICARRKTPLKVVAQQTNGVAAFGGVLPSSPDRLVKSKSEQMLFSQEPASPDESSLGQKKSRSLEPLGISGLALWSGDPVIVELQKEDKGLGFSILDYQDPLDADVSMIIIRSLVPGGVAQVDGRLVPGDRLVSVNDISLVSATLDQAVQALKGAAKGTVKIGVLKPMPGTGQDDSQQDDTSIEEAEPADAAAAESIFSSLMMTPLQLPSYTAPPPPQMPSPPAYPAASSPPYTHAAAAAAVVTSSPSRVTVSRSLDADVTMTTIPVVKAQPITSDLSSMPSSGSSSSPAAVASIVPLSGVKHDVQSISSKISSSSLPQTIKIALTSGQLGLRLESEGRTGCCIRSIEADSVISKDGRLRVGDYVTAINSDSLQNVSNAQARSLLRRTSLLGKDFSLTFFRGRETVKSSAEDEDVFLPMSSYSSANETTPSHSSFKQHSPDVSSNERSSSFLLQPLSPLTLSPLAAAPSSSAEQTSQLPSAMILSSSETIDKQVFGSPTSAQVPKSWGPARLVEVHRKSGEALGISVIAGRVEVPKRTSDGLQTVSGIFIKHVLPISPASKTGQLRTGDRILEVDGVDLRDVTHDFAIDVIRKSTTPVQFLVQSCVDAPDSVSEDKESTVAAAALADKISDEASKNSESLLPLESLQKRYSELGGELHLVELEKDSSGLGISLAGNRSLSTMSVFVVAIQPDSIAEKSGLILLGDELLEINEHVLYGRSHLNASAIIKSITTSRVRLVILRRDDFQHHIAVHPTPSPRHSPTPPDRDLHSTLISPIPAALENEEAASDISAPSINDTSGSAYAEFDPEIYANVREITLEKGNKGFGFAIEEKNDSGSGIGIFVKSVTSDGPAAEEGTLSVGDQILMVNESSFLGCTYEQALDVLRLISRGTNVKLILNKNTSDEIPGIIEPMTVENVASSPPVVEEAVVVAHQSVTNKAPPTPHKDPVPTVHADPVNEDNPATCQIVPGKETTIEITKAKSGLGLSIVGGADTQLGSVIVHEVYEDGAAAKDGRLWAGDQILAVDGEDLRNATHERAIQVLRQTPAVVRMIVFRDESLLKDEDLYDTLNVDMVKKPGRGLGFSIVGKQHDNGVFIADLVKGGVAEADGRLMSGDQILSINGEDVSNSTQEHVAEMLKVAMGTIKIRVSRLKGGSGAQNSNQGIKKSTSNLHNAKLAKSGTSMEEDLSSDILVIELDREERRLIDLTLNRDMSTRFDGTPLVVTSVEGNNSVMEKLQIDDRILKINDRLADLMTPDEVLWLIKHGSDRVVLEIFRESGTVHDSKMKVAGCQETVSIGNSSNDLGHQEIGDRDTVRTVKLQRGEQGFGFSIVGGFGSPQGNLPIYIKTVFENSVAAETGQLKRGDCLVSVNGISLEGFTHDQAVGILKSAQGTVVLRVTD